MSTISTDGGYRYTQRAVSEIEDEMRAEQKARVYRDEAAIGRLEENYKESVAREKARAEEAIEATKRAARDEISRERFNLKRESEQLRKQTYDRMGRYNGEEAGVVKEQLNATQRALEAEHEKFVRAQLETEENYHRKLENNTREHQAEMERVSENIRANVVGPYEEYVAKQKQLAADEKTKSQTQYDRLNQERMDELNYQRQRTARAVDEVKQDYDHRAQKLENDRDERIVKSAQRTNEEAAKDIERMRDAHALETADLRQVVRDVIAQTKEEQKQKAEREYQEVTGREEDRRRSEKRLVDSYESELEAMKYKHGIAENYFHRRSSEAIREKDGYFSGLIREQEQKAFLNQKELQKEFDRSLTQAEQMRKHEQELASARLSQAMQDSSKRQQEMLESQAKNYQETMANQQSVASDQISALQKELRRNLSATSLQDVTPAQENAVRKSLIADYEDKFEREHERNKGTVDSIQRSYSERLNETIDQKEQEKTSMARRAAEDSNRDRSEFISSVREVEENRAQAIKSLEDQNARTIEDMQRMYASAMEKQRRNYEELLEKTRSESSMKLADTRRDLQFEKTKQIRESQARTAELLREQERKLADQVAVYQDQIDQLKGQLVKEREELVKQSQRDIEEQRKSFEHRIAALESQQQERERYLTQNYEQAMDRMRRAQQSQLNKRG
jgi:hypothetical protein